MEVKIKTALPEEPQVIYEGTIFFTEVLESGLGLPDLLTGKATLPPAGACFDVGYKNSLQGPKISGTITVTDYLYIRANGRLQLHIPGRITTPDGAYIAVFAEAAGRDRSMWN